MKKTKNYILAAAGIILFLSGLFFLKTADSTQASFMTALPYVCIGVGCGVFGYGMSGILSAKIVRRTPDLQKQIEINNNDERNITIANRAKAKAYDLMIFVLGALLLVFVLLGVDVIPVLLFVLTYLLLQGYAVYFRCKLEKEM